MFSNPSIKIIKYIFYFLSSIILVIIIGIKDSAFEYIWMYRMHNTIEFKVEAKLAYDITLTTFQAIFILYSFTSTALHNSSESRD